MKAYYKDRQEEAKIGKKAFARKKAAGGITADSPQRKAMQAFYKEQQKAAEDKAKAAKDALESTAKSAKAAQREAENLAKSKRSANRLALLADKRNSAQEEGNRLALKMAVARAKDAEEIKDIIAQERSRLRVQKKQTAEAKKQLGVLNRLKTSSKQFAGNMVSAFAVAGGAAAITSIGQDFESVNNTMLAVSDNSLQAGENLAFVKDEAYRLGLGLKESTKGFAKMVAARGNMSLGETKAAFTGISEMSTVLGLSAEESGRAINALQQMMSKGVVSAEELKLQMGEVLPNAIPLMAKAAQDAGLSVNGTVSEMMDLQQKGALLSEKVLPHFARRMSEAAQANGGLASAMNSNRVAMNRMKTSMQSAADSFFQGGFSEGLTEVFDELAYFLKANEDTWAALGKIAGSTLKVLTIAFRALTFPLQYIGSALKFVTDIFGDFSFLLSTGTTAAVLGFTKGLYTIPKGLDGVKAGIRSLFGVFKKFAKVILKPLILLGMIEEALAWLFNKDLKGVWYDSTLNPKADSYDKTKAESMTDLEKNQSSAISATSYFGDNWFTRFLDTPITSFFGGGSGGEGGSKKVERAITSNNAPLNIKTTVELDGEKVGESVANTRTFSTNIDNIFEDSIGDNF